MHSPFNPYYLSICLELSVTLVALLASFALGLPECGPTGDFSFLQDPGNKHYSQRCLSKTAPSALPIETEKPFHCFLCVRAHPLLLMLSLPSTHPPVLPYLLPARV